MEQQRSAVVDVEPEPRDLSTAHLEIVLRPEGGVDAESGQAGDDAVGVAAQKILGCDPGRGSRADRHPQLARSHQDRPAAGWPPAVLHAPRRAGFEVDLVLQVLVATDQSAVRSIGVQTEGRFRLRVLVAAVPQHQRLVGGEAVGGADAFVSQIAPGAHAFAHVREQQYS